MPKKSLSANSKPYSILGTFFSFGKRRWDKELRGKEAEGIDNASVKICHLSIDITAEIVIKPIITNSLNLVHTKK